jgi:hypothetical protein
MTLRWNAPLLCLLVAQQLLAQTGPGGVGGSGTNILWLDANYGVTAPTAGVTSWADRSGAGNTVSQANANLQPAYLTNTINGYPTLQFDNDQTNPDWMSKADNSTLEGMSGLTAFCVYQLATGTTAVVPRCLFSKRNAPDNQEAYAWFLYNGGGAGTTVNQYLDIDGTGSRLNSSSAYTTATTYVNSFVYDGTTTTNANDQTLYDGNNAVGNSAETSTAIPNYTSDLYVGSLRGHTGTGASTTRFNGYISEVIMYNYALGSAQRTIVNNYLAAKYGTTLATNDLYVQDNAGNGNYDHDVAGIGRISSTDQQTDSRGSGIVEISGATNLDNNEFCFWGHNNGGLWTTGTSDYPAGLVGRWNRVWRTSEVTTAASATDVGAVDITFHLQGLNIGATAPTLRLLVDANNNGVFADDTPISGAVFIGQQRYMFPGVTALTNGLRFTLGTTDLGSSLPIELLYFKATPEGAAVNTTWATASEHDNALFTLERSADGVAWNTLDELEGAGNSESLRTYNAIDREPLAGLSYYRLRQTDMDGASTLSAMVPVTRRTDADAPSIFPNPSAGRFTVLMNPVKGSVQLYDGSGRVLNVPVLYRDDRAEVDATRLPEGLYYIHIGDADQASAYPVMLSER